jgi:hypothetical protein
VIVDSFIDVCCWEIVPADPKLAHEKVGGAFVTLAVKICVPFTAIELICGITVTVMF